MTQPRRLRLLLPLLVATGCGVIEAPPGPLRSGPATPLRQNQCLEPVTRTRPTLELDLGLPDPSCSAAEVKTETFAVFNTVQGDEMTSQLVLYEITQTTTPHGQRCRVDIAAESFTFKEQVKVPLSPFRADVSLCDLALITRHAPWMTEADLQLAHFEVGAEADPSRLAPEHPPAPMRVGSRQDPNCDEPMGRDVVERYDHGFRLRYTLGMQTLHQAVLGGELYIALRAEQLPEL